MSLKAWILNRSGWGFSNSIILSASQALAIAHYFQWSYAGLNLWRYWLRASIFKTEESKKIILVKLEKLRNKSYVLYWRMEDF